MDWNYLGAWVMLDDTRERYDNVDDAGKCIALIGIGCRYPGGSNDPRSFWETLMNGVDCISEVPDDRWRRETFYHPKQKARGKSVTRWGGFIDRVREFDAGFFGVSPREAALIDPQQRMLLEVCWEALEDAGQVPSQLRDRAVGVYMGGFTLDYMLMQLGGGDYRSVDAHTATGSMMTLLAARLSYVFGFRGPSMSIDTACSSSLVATHLACQSLISGESDVALAGGVNAMLGPSYTIAESQAGMMSPTGRSRAFDSRADGYVRGEGAGIVVLKRLADAIASGDPIHAVIRGTAVNQDGHSEGITVPSGEAQQQVMRRAYRQAGVDPAEVCYVEAHGTGTPVGDPIEVNAIGAVVGEGRDADEPCLVGSLKTNMGHTEAAAGVAGLIKAALTLATGMVPPHLHYLAPNDRIDFNALKLQVPTVATRLPRKGAKALVSVNSFGFGGTNAHAVLESAPAFTRGDRSPSSCEGLWMLPLSARHPGALRQLGSDYAAALSDGGMLAETPLDAICWTAATRREHHLYRACITGHSREELLAALRDQDANTFLARERATPVFVYSGSGPQWWGMGQQLYRCEPVFRASIDRCAALFKTVAGWDILEHMLADGGTARSDDTDVAQSAGFMLQVGLTDLLAACGVTPSVIVGHSLGEVAAVYAAGALDLPDAVRVIHHRSRLLHRVAGQGAMLAVGLSEVQARAEVALLADPTVTVAAINGPTQVTIAGSADGIDSLAATLQARGVFAKKLRVKVPFHSAFMDPLKDDLLASLEGIQPRVPRVPLYSTVTGVRVEGAAHDPGYWFGNIRQPVRFADAVNALVTAGHSSFLELSPHPVLATSISECAIAAGVAARTIPSLYREQDEPLQLARMIGELYCAGADIAWDVRLTPSHVVPLPRYPWRGGRHWNETPLSSQSRLQVPCHPLLTRRVDNESPTWEGDLDGPLLGFLQDHNIEGTVVFPGAGYVDMMAFAAQSLFGDLAVVTFSDITFERALYLSEDRTRVLRISVDPGSYDVRIASRPYEDASAKWELHCRGKIHSSDQCRHEIVDLDGLLKQCPHEVQVEECYAYFRRLGLQYGPTFRGIASLRQGHDQAVSWVQVPHELHGDVGRFCIHPAILDQCFQTLAAALPMDSEGSTVYMPTGVTQGRSYATLPLRVCMHATVTHRDARGISGDVRVYDAQGALVLEILGCRAKVLGGQVGALLETPQRMFAPAWRRLPAAGMQEARAPGRWLLLGRGGLVQDIAAAFAAAGHACVDVFGQGGLDPADSASWEAFLGNLDTDLPLRGVLQLALHDERAGTEPCMAELEHTCLVTLNAVKALSALTQVEMPRLWLVTRGTQRVVDGDCPEPFHGAVWGLARVLGHHEHINLWGGIIDLDDVCEADEAARIVDACVAPDGEDQIAWRAGERHVMRLESCADEVKLVVPPRLRADASYLVTGGLGALGLSVSRWMVERGARHLILAGRTGLPARSEWSRLDRDDPQAKVIAQLLELEQLGANVLVECLDVADASAVDQLRDRVRHECRPPIRGVIHSAGTARPRLLGQSDNAEFLSVLPAKVAGAWNLHTAFADTPLDFFVLFSSVAALVTSMGQGNYAAANTFLDLLAQQRRASGLPALSINWGPWGDVGMATQLDLITYFHNRGLYPMSAEQGCQALGSLLSGRTAQAVVLGARWSLVRDSSPLGIAAPMLGEVLAAELALDGPDEGAETAGGILAGVQERLAASKDLAAVEETIASHVRELACRILRTDVANLEFDTNISDLGLDSMMAIELKNRIEQSLSVSISVVDLLKGVTPRQIAGPLAAQVLADRALLEDSAVKDILDNLGQLSQEEIASLLADDSDAEQVS
jgi:acyl transferase domain-containing protein/acyl carrier protein